MIRRELWRTVAAVGIVLTLGVQLTDTVRLALDAGLGPADTVTAVVNWFSFFTTMSAAVAVVALLFRSATVRISAAAYTVIAGLGYFLLLGGLSDPVGSSDWWTNGILHAVVPVVMLVDLWVGRRSLVVSSGRSVLWKSLLLPAAWAVYTMIRGPLVDAPFSADPWWYPYGFIDPHVVIGGYLGALGMYVLVGGVLSVLVLGLSSAPVRTDSGSDRQAH
jgi:hypothetical protein